MYALADAAVYAESTKHHLPVDTRIGVPSADYAACCIDEGGLRLQHVKVVWRAHSKADVALKVSRPIVVALLARAMLRKVLGGSHHELGHIDRIGHLSRLYGAVKVAIQGGKMNEGLVVEMRKDHSLELAG